MENGTIVALVLGSNAVIFLGNWLLMRKQLKHSDEQLDKRLEIQREADKHEREREVKSEPLLKLSFELARMAAKGERVVALVRSMMHKVKMEVDSKFGGWVEKGEVPDELNEAVGEWNSYMASGVFRQVLFMQYDSKLVERVDEVRREYDGARYFMNVTDIRKWFGWLSEEGKRKEVEAINEKIDKNIDLIIKSREEIAEVQSEIRRRLVEL